MKILLDVHTHTVASGHAFSTLQEMVRTAADKGLQILGITEHTGGIPGTCSPIYFRNLPVVPRLMYGVELLLGAEINIVDYEGSLDLEEEYFKFLDFIRCVIGRERSSRIHWLWKVLYVMVISTLSVTPVTVRPICFLNR